MQIHVVHLYNDDRKTTGCGKSFKPAPEGQHRKTRLCKECYVKYVQVIRGNNG